MSGYQPRHLVCSLCRGHIDRGAPTLTFYVADSTRRMMGRYCSESCLDVMRAVLALRNDGRDHLADRLLAHARRAPAAV